METSGKNVLYFKVGSLRLALHLHLIERVVRAVAVQPIPDSDPIVHGIINYYSELILVINLRHRFGLPLEPISTKNKFIIVTSGNNKFALVVDEIEAVKNIELSDWTDIDIPYKEIESTEETFLKESRKFMKDESGIILFYDFDQLISNKVMKYLEKLAESALATQ